MGTTHGGALVAGAMRDARIARLDGRGLVPLEDARAAVRAADAFRRGSSRMVGGTSVTDADLLWAALLSLEDADELVTEARRLRWEFHVRGRENLALLERYGEGILPWLESRLDDAGVLFNVPWCVVPCLLAIDTRQAFALALRVEAVHDVLPGQAQLAGGPGIFADDDEPAIEGEPSLAGEPAVGGPEEAVGFAHDTRGFDLAKAWIAAHPEGTFFAVEMARAGDARARGLLAEQAAAVGSTTFDELEARLGADAARAVFAELSLPRATLPTEVQAVLDEAEVAPVPRGPILGIAALDVATRQYDFPLWDNANVAVTASRVRGFVSAKGDVLAVETVAYHPGGGGPPEWSCAVFASRHTRAPDDVAVLDAGDVETTWIDDASFVDGYANILRVHPHAVRDPFEGELVVRVIQPLAGSDGEDVSFPAGLPDDFRAPPPGARIDLDVDVRLISAAEAALVQIGQRRPDLLFPTSRDLARALGIEDAELLFDLDRVDWPAAGDPASSSNDFVAMVAALRLRRRLTRLPGPGTSTPLHWLPACASLRFFDGPDPWPEGDPFALPLPDDGPGATPIDSRLLLRGWPHGTSLAHAPAYNARGSGRGVVAHAFTPGGARWVMTSRVGACALARAAGSVTAAWTLDDPGVAAAVVDESPLTPDEARGIVARFVAGPPAPRARLGAELVFVLEALVGPGVTIEAFAAALAAAPPARWRLDASAVGAALFELGVLLRRTRAPREPLRALLAQAHAGAGHPEVRRALDLVLHGRAGAERSARCEGDFLHVDDDPAWARARILDPATPASVEDLALLPIAGDALLDRYAARIDRLIDRAWLALQLPKAASPKAAALLARLG